MCESYIVLENGEHVHCQLAEEDHIRFPAIIDNSRTMATRHVSYFQAVAFYESARGMTTQVMYDWREAK